MNAQRGFASNDYNPCREFLKLFLSYITYMFSFFGNKPEIKEEFEIFPKGDDDCSDLNLEGLC